MHPYTEGSIGITMLSSLHWSHKSLGGVISSDDACAMRSQHVDVSFNHLAGELPGCLIDGTAASKTALLGGNRFHTLDAVPKIGKRLDTLNVAFNDIGGDLGDAVEGGRPLMTSLHVGGNTRMSGDIAAVLAAVPNVEHLDVAGTAMSATSSAAAAAALTSAAHLTNYHVGGAAFVPVLGVAKKTDAALVDKLEVVVTFSESIKYFCGGCPDTVLHMSGFTDCGKSACAKQLRLRALDCAVAHAVNAAHPAAANTGADHESTAHVISESDVSRESIVPYASARLHAGKPDLVLVKLTVKLKAGVTPTAASSIAGALASLDSLDTPAVCAHHVEAAYAVRGALPDPDVVGWRLPAAVVAAQPACGVGVMGRSCAYICPAEWTKEASLESQGIDAMYTMYGGDSEDSVTHSKLLTKEIDARKSEAMTSLLGKYGGGGANSDADAEEEQQREHEEHEAGPYTSPLSQLNLSRC